MIDIINQWLIGGIYIKKIAIALIFIICISSSISATSENEDTYSIESNEGLNFNTNDWEKYPYFPSGTDISFPKDEGRHANFKQPKEWWYANFHLVGSTSGKEYGAFVSYFYPYPMMGFSISDISEEKTYSMIKYGLLISKTGKLDLTFISKNFCDRWYTKTENGDLLPFQYKMVVTANAREEKRDLMKLDLDMRSLKAPLIVGGTGLVEIANGMSYYYSLTKIEVIGKITLNGYTEDVTGFAWFDHQWGDFNVGGPRNRVFWEWFSIKLDDGSEIMVGDGYWVYNRQYYGKYAGGVNLLQSDNSLILLENYKITPLDYWTDPISCRKFSSKWMLTEESKNIELIITPDYSNQVLRFGFKPAAFWEGSCYVAGSINGKNVTGKAYVELTHAWNSYFSFLAR
jgi:predicted secreted hydrolase